MYLKTYACLTTVLIFLSGCYSEKNSPDYNVSSLSSLKNVYPCIVLGSGAAGLTAANYLAQANIPVTLLEGKKPGGALAQSDSVRNWPGVMNAPGHEIITSLRNQAVKNGAKIHKEQLVNANLTTWPFELLLENVETQKTRTIKTLSCVIAIGAKPNYLHVPGEQQYWGKGVSNCAVCDGGLYKNKHVAIVGGGDSAIEEASYLSGIAKTVDIFVRKDHFRAKDIKKRDEVVNRDNVHVFFNTEVTQISGDNKKITNLKLFNNRENKYRNISIDGLFLAIGATPNTQLFNNQLKLDNAGYIKLYHDQETSIKGVFAAGDICDPVYKQAVIAAGHGCIAALQVQHFLQDINYQAQGVSVNKQAEETEEQEINYIETTSTQEFHKALNASSYPLVIDVSANLCISCKNMEPIFEKLADKFRGKVNFMKVNISNPAINISRITSLLGGKDILSVPVFLFIKGKKEIARLEGEIPFDKFSQEIEKLLL